MPNDLTRTTNSWAERTSRITALQMRKLRPTRGRDVLQGSQPESGSLPWEPASSSTSQTPALIKQLKGKEAQLVILAKPSASSHHLTPGDAVTSISQVRKLRVKATPALRGKRAAAQGGPWLLFSTFSLSPHLGQTCPEPTHVTWAPHWRLGVRETAQSLLSGDSQRRKQRVLGVGYVRTGTGHEGTEVSSPHILVLGQYLRGVW